MLNTDNVQAVPRPVHTFPCVACEGAGIIERYDDPEKPDEVTSGPSTCWSCKGSGKSDRQILMEIQETQAQILELLRRPAPAQVPGRRDVIYGPGPGGDLVGPGRWKNPAIQFPAMTEEDRDAMRQEMLARQAEREKK
jgi:hypothetical protein